MKPPEEHYGALLDNIAESKEEADLERIQINNQISELTDRKRELDAKEETEILYRVNAIDNIIAEMVEKDRIPQHEKIVGMYKAAPNPEGVEICKNFVHRAMGNPEPAAGEKFLDITESDKVTYIRDIDEVNRQEGTPGEPQFFVKPIWKEEKTIFGLRHWPNRKFAKTDEVLVVVKLNNGTKENPGNNTVVEILGKTITTAEGKVLLETDIGAQGLFTLESQGDFTRGLRAEHPTYMDKARRAEITIPEYLDSYKKEHGETIFQYHEKRDKKLAKDPDYINTEKVLEEFIEDIPERYTHQLEGAQHFREHVIDELEEYYEKKQRNLELVMADSSFWILTTQLDRFVREDAERIAKGKAPKYARQINATRAAILHHFPAIQADQLDLILNG